MRKSHSHSNRLWLAVRFPHFVFQAQGLSLTEDTLSVVAEKQKVIWASPTATEAGVCLGMAATTAEVLTGAMAQIRNPLAEQQCLQELSDWAYQFTPYIQIYQSSSATQTAQMGLLLEISSCLDLFKGVNSLIEELEKGLQQKSLSFVIGQAHSAYAAWLLSFFHYAVIHNTNVDENTSDLFIERLKQLPIQLLHDYPKIVDALDKTGFNTLGDIARQIQAQSISSIKKRWGAEFTDMLSELFVLDADFQQAALFTKPVNYYQPTEYFQEQIQFDYPIANSEQLEKPIEDLLKKLAAYLLKRQLDSQQIEWTLSDIYHRQQTIAIYADNSQSHWKLFYDLTLIQLESRELSFEVDCLSLKVQHLLPAQKQTHQFNFNQQDTKNNQQNFTITAAKLKARMGDVAMAKVSYRDSHIPEVSNQLIAVNKPSQQVLPDIHEQGLRPSWVFKKPIEIDDKQGLFWRGRLQLLVGPERIQGNWWKKPTARDYFLAQRQDDIRLWIFWDLHQQAWFVQGVFQ